MKHIFVIGEKEKHEVEVERSYWGKVIVNVDGTEVLRKRVKRRVFYGIDVGKEEIHKIKFRLYGRRPKIEFFVDGEPQQSTKDILSRWEIPVHFGSIVFFIVSAILFCAMIAVYLLQGAVLPPYTRIENRTVYFVFKTSDQTLHYWSVSIETLENTIVQGNRYRESMQYVNLSDNETGENYRVVDLRPFIVENNFSIVILDLYHELGNNDEALVHEVWYVVTQLTMYHSQIMETPRFPLETFIGGGGDCEDMAILIASMLKAAPADYVVKLVYMDADNPTDAQGVNHATVWVETPSGYKTFVEGTSHTEMCPFTQVDGWYFEV